MAIVDDRVLKLEQAVKSVEESVNSVEKNVKSSHNGQLEITKVNVRLVTVLEHIEETLNRLVDGEGVARCVRHSEHLSSLEKDLETNKREYIGYIKRVENDLKKNQERLEVSTE